MSFGNGTLPSSANRASISGSAKIALISLLSVAPFQRRLFLGLQCRPLVLLHMLETLTHTSSHLPGREHWAYKNGARLFLWEKQRAADTDHHGTILFVHGSSWASLATFDLHVPGRPYSSVMDWFSVRGFDCWCFDAEGYGRSDKHRDSQFGIESGADDVDAATDYILNLRRLDSVLLYGVHQAH